MNRKDLNVVWLNRNETQFVRRDSVHLLLSSGVFSCFSWHINSVSLVLGQTELESVALDDIVELKAMLDSGVFNSLLTISVQSNRKHTVFIFQCEDVRVRTSTLSNCQRKDGSNLHVHCLSFTGRLRPERTQPSNHTLFKKQVTDNTTLFFLWYSLIGSNHDASHTFYKQQWRNSTWISGNEKPEQHESVGTKASRELQMGSLRWHSTLRHNPSPYWIQLVLFSWTISPTVHWYSTM